MSDTQEIPSSQDPRDWSEPAPFPQWPLVKLYFEYCEYDPGEHRPGYVEDAAKIILDWFFDNYQDLAPWNDNPHHRGCDTRDVIEGALWQAVPEDGLEEIIDTALGRLADVGCGDRCQPLFGWPRRTEA